MLQTEEATRVPPAFVLTTLLKVISTWLEQILDAISETGHFEIAEQIGLIKGLIDKAQEKAAQQELYVDDLVRELEMKTGECQICYDILELIGRILKQDHPQTAELYLLNPQEKRAKPNL